MKFYNAIEWKKKTGIYMIENHVNGNRYIGSASRCLYQRFHQHKSNLSKNKHCNKHLQNAWNKYGADSFEFWVMEEYEPEYCAGMEHWWLQMASPEYNLNTNTVTRLGAKISEEMLIKLRNRKVSEETKVKIKKARSNQMFSSEALERRAKSIQNKFNTPIGCSNGNVYSSVTEAEKDLNIPASSISRVLTRYTAVANTKHKLDFWYINDKSNAAKIKYCKQKGQ